MIKELPNQHSAILQVLLVWLVKMTRNLGTNIYRCKEKSSIIKNIVRIAWKYAFSDMVWHAARDTQNIYLSFLCFIGDNQKRSHYRGGFLFHEYFAGFYMKGKYVRNKVGCRVENKKGIPTTFLNCFEPGTIWPLFGLTSSCNCLVFIHPWPLIAIPSYDPVWKANWQASVLKSREQIV